MNRDNYIKQLLALTPDALKLLTVDIRAQVDAGLMNNKEAHDRINCVAAAIMTKQMVESLGVENVCR